MSSFCHSKQIIYEKNIVAINTFMLLTVLSKIWVIIHAEEHDGT